MLSSLANISHLAYTKGAKAKKAEVHRFSNELIATSKKIASKGEVVANIKINKNISDTIELVLKDDEYLVSKKGEGKDVKRVIQYNEVLKAPIIKDTVVGKLQFVDESGNVIHETELIASKDVQKSSLWDYMVYIMNTYIIRELKNVC